MPDSIYSRARRRSTYPGFHSISRKPRRWPLVLRVTKGSVHLSIILPVAFHCAWTSLVVFLDRYVGNVGLPGSIVPSLSIVVGLMLVFRNGTSYDRFWSGRNCLTGVTVGVRSLARYFLVYCRDAKGESTEAERQDTEKVVRMLMALLYAVKHNLRREFVGITAAPGTPYPRSPGTQTPITSVMNSQMLPQQQPYSDGNPGQYRPPLADSIATLYPTYSGLLPPELLSLEDQGLALPLQLAMPIESYIRRGVIRGWWAAPQASYLSGQLNALLQAFSQMETIRCV
jgi:ion channel-forming bestrophin family protein